MTRETVLSLVQDRRTRPMVYTRVMGYHRPVESFNKGKLGEHRQRLYFADDTDLRHLPVHRT